MKIVWGKNHDGYIIGVSPADERYHVAQVINGFRVWREFSGRTDFFFLGRADTVKRARALAQADADKLGAEVHENQSKERRP